MVSKKLADFILGVDLRKNKDHLNQTYLNNLIADAIVCALAGTKGPCADIVLKTYSGLSNLQQSSIIGSSRKTSVPYAAFINTFFARNYTFDDTYEAGVIHSGSAVTMSSLALGEWLNSRIEEALGAIVAGYEVATRVAGALNPSHYERGFHPTGTCNTLGVAALASKFLHLDAEKVSTALRIAADEACGFRQYQLDGSIVNSAFHAAKAAENGIMAALLAQEGFADPGDTLSGKFGLFHNTADTWDADTLLGNLGSHFLFLGSSLKPYPSCRYMHGAVDATAKCMKENNLTLADIKAINVYTFKLAFEEGNRPQPQTVLDAQFSIHYNVAAYLWKGALGVEDFAPEALRQPEVLNLCHKIKVFEAPDLSENYPTQWPFRVEVISRSGKTFSHQVSFPPGSTANPLEADEFEKKCLLLLKPVMAEKRAKELLLRLKSLEDFATVPNLLNYLKEIMS